MMTHWSSKPWGPGKWPPIPRILYVVLATWILVVGSGLVRLGSQGWGEVERVDPVAGRDAVLVTVDALFGGSQVLFCSNALAGDLVPGRWAAYRGDPKTVADHRLLEVGRLRQLADTRTVLWTDLSDRATEWIDALATRRPLAAGIGVGILLLGAVFLRLLGSLTLAAGGLCVLWFVVLWLGRAGLADLSSGLVVASLLLPASGAVVHASFRRWSTVNRWIQRLALAAMLLLLAEGFSGQLGWPVAAITIAAGMGPLLSPVIGLWLLGSLFLALGLAASHASLVIVLVLSFVGTHLLCGGNWFPGVQLRRLPMRRSRMANPHGEIPLASLLANERKERS